SYVKKKIDKLYLIWFQSSNLYFQLEEPAWFVFKKIVKRYKSETIAKMFADRYELSYEISLKFVVEIRQKVDEMNRPISQKKYIEKTNDEVDNHVYSIYSKHCYDMHN